ncbi:MAG: Uma2 family endonuclease [Thermoleophilaceae bacterium]
MRSRAGERRRWRFDIGAKKRGYERQGLPELWLVDTEAAEILVFRRSRAGTAEFDVALELAAGDHLESPQLSGRLRRISSLRRRVDHAHTRVHPPA